jgi:hypothetical protein
MGNGDKNQETGVKIKRPDVVVSRLREFNFFFAGDAATEVVEKLKNRHFV